MPSNQLARRRMLAVKAARRPDSDDNDDDFEITAVKSSDERALVLRKPRTETATTSTAVTLYRPNFATRAQNMTTAAMVPRVMASSHSAKRRGIAITRQEKTVTTVTTTTTSTTQTIWEVDEGRDGGWNNSQSSGTQPRDVGWDHSQSDRLQPITIEDIEAEEAPRAAARRLQVQNSDEEDVKEAYSWIPPTRSIKDDEEEEEDVKPAYVWTPPTTRSPTTTSNTTTSTAASTSSSASPPSNTGTALIPRRARGQKRRRGSAAPPPATAEYMSEQITRELITILSSESEQDEGGRVARKRTGQGSMLRSSLPQSRRGVKREGVGIDVKPLRR